MEMKIEEVIEKEMIMPAIPTPHHLRTLQLTCLDQFIPPVYTAAIFVYDHTLPREMISNKLKKSLSETLVRFYPLAGKLEGACINCNDEGAAFTEARADCLLSDFLRNMDNGSREQLVPKDVIAPKQPLDELPLLQVKVTYFRHGGLAMAICISHKICDAASLVTFACGWAATAKGCADAVIPEFNASTIFPPADVSFKLPPLTDSYAIRGTCMEKMFVFDASKIAELKREVASETVEDPMRVEAVVTLIWKCARRASSHSNPNTPRPSAMTLGVDLRRRIPPTHLSPNAIGNLLSLILVTEGRENDIESHKTVGEIRKAKEEISKMVKENLRGHEIDTAFGEKIVKATASLNSELKPDMDIYPVTCWCRMPFYQTDFGWGNPVWVAPGPNSQAKNVKYAILMDTHDGEGIEAWVCLPEQDMLVFEHDEELLAFATPCKAPLP